MTSDFNVYPNPTSTGIVNFEYTINPYFFSQGSNQDIQGMLILRNPMGNQVYQEQFIATPTGQITIDLYNLPEAPATYP